MSVVTFGESLGLLTAPRNGRLELLASLDLAFGGAESNVAIGLARLGVEATWMGRLGDDSIGRLIERELRAEGVAVCAVRDPDASTALMVKERPRAGTSVVTYYRNGSAGGRFSSGDLDLERIREARVLHLTGITAALGDRTRGAIAAALTVAREAGVLVTFDVNHRSSLWSEVEAAPVYRSIAAQSDIVFAGSDEAALLVGEASVDEQLERLTGLGPAQAVIKTGVEGAIALVDGVRFDQPAFAVQTVDTVGAGDAFVAGYLAGLLHGETVEARLRMAAACGAIACTASGDWEASADADEVTMLISSGVDPVKR